MDLAKAVKSRLSCCPSDIQEEVLAFQSIKKGLPDSCRCMEKSLLDGLVANVIGGRPPSLPPGYLAFVKRITSSIFSKGWDTGYEGYCRRFSPPLKGVLESGRSSGGSLGYLANCRGNDHSDYLETALFGRENFRTGPLGRLTGALQVIQSAGKPRPLTTFSADGAYLRPLHKTIYDRLSKQKWLSRGDVTSDSLRRAGFKQGLGTLTSGDYASATDNLSIEVMEACLEAMLGNCAVVPPNIREFALSACRPFLFASREEWLLSSGLDQPEDFSTVGEPRKGQMMGSYLSFPLLCLQNYLAFRWSTRQVRSKIPVIINGDDILFQSDVSTSSAWMVDVGVLGLQVEPTKTSVSDDYGSLNSTLLRWRRGELVVSPTLRFGMLRKPEYPNNLGKTFSSFLKGIQGPIRWRAGVVFFQAHRGVLGATSWSLPSLGFRGALAHRLSRFFGFLDAGRSSGVPPAAPITHSVCLPLDLVSEVPNEFVDTELAEVNACETASWKWGVGFSQSARVSNAIQYAIVSSFNTVPQDCVEDLVNGMSMHDRAFSFRYQGFSRLGAGGGGGGRVTIAGSSRRTLKSPFFVVDTPVSVTRVFSRVADECLGRVTSEDFFAVLPTYGESILE